MIEISEVKAPELAVFTGYAQRPQGFEPALIRGDLLSILKVGADQTLTCQRSDLSGMPRSRRCHVVLPEEVIRINSGLRELQSPTPLELGRGLSADDATPERLEKILSEPQSKGYKDLRDRVSYMYLTGTYPSHLRPFFTKTLTLIIQLHTSPANAGPMRLDEDMTERLDLEGHPMVRKAREYIAAGWRIKISKGPNIRKPYTKIFMFNDDQRITVQIDGSIMEGWD